MPMPAVIADRTVEAPSAERTLAYAFMGAALGYILVYCFEGPVRYGLYLAGKDDLILLRDLLIWAPLGALFALQAYRGRIHPVFLIAGALFAFHGLVLVGTVGNLLSVVYGVKILINLLFGFFLAGALLIPSPRTTRFLAVVWVITLIGLCLDKAGVVFPWVGIRTMVGDLNVDVSKDWFIQDPLSRRVAGFTRSSIGAAATVPLLTIALMSGVRRPWVRVAIALLAVVAVALTTQKGALIAFTAVAGVLCLPSDLRVPSLRALVVGFMVLALALPALTLGVRLDHGSGVFSAESLFLRIAYTWPDAWAWITRHELFPFGVGLGGISGPQRIYAPDYFNPADNIFVLMYAYFGVMMFLYVAWTLWIALHPAPEAAERLTPALAIVAFVFGYGAVLSVIEDQSASLFLGAALGLLWHEGRAAAAARAVRFRPILSEAGT